MAFRLATGAHIPAEPQPTPKPEFHPVLGFNKPEEK